MKEGVKKPFKFEFLTKRTKDYAEYLLDIRMATLKEVVEAKGDTK